MQDAATISNHLQAKDEGSSVPWWLVSSQGQGSLNQLECLAKPQWTKWKCCYIFGHFIINCTFLSQVLRTITTFSCRLQTKDLQFIGKTYNYSASWLLWLMYVEWPRFHSSIQPCCYTLYMAEQSFLSADMSVLYPPQFALRIYQEWL